MKRGMRNTAAILGAFLIGACTRVGHIQQASPVSQLQFTGSHKSMALCVQQRLKGKVREEGFGESYVIYDSVQKSAGDGLTHYAITVRRTSADAGFAEWRIVSPPVGTQSSPKPVLTPAAYRQYWTPVEECAAQKRGS